MSDGKVFDTKAQYIHIQLTLNGFSLLVENVHDFSCHSCDAFFIMTLTLIAASQEWKDTLSQNLSPVHIIYSP
jgi:putative sterol carrier protein